MDYVVPGVCCEYNVLREGGCVWAASRVHVRDRLRQLGPNVHTVPIRTLLDSDWAMGVMGCPAEFVTGRVQRPDGQFEKAPVLGLLHRARGGFTTVLFPLRVRRGARSAGEEAGVGLVQYDSNAVDVPTVAKARTTVISYIEV